MHVNALNSSTMETSYSGAVNSDLLYYPWGDLWQDTALQDFQYGGAFYMDWLTSADFTPNRFYRYDLGRWLTPDPLGLAAADLTNPQSLNLYAYVRNNPTTLTDPSGLLLCDCSWMGTCGGFGGGGAVYVNGIQQTVFQTSGLGSSELQNCPLNFCSGFATIAGSGDVGFFQFTAGAGLAPSGYQLLTQPVNPSDPSSYPGYLDAFNNQLNATIAALEAKGATDKQIQQFISANSWAFNYGAIGLQGGNFDFTNVGNGAAIFNFGCSMDRCDMDSLGTLDFSHNDGTFHLDTASPYTLPFGALVHLGVDVILGSFWYQFIPRPWP
jgi:RHS repeat-associated protein